LEPLRPLQPADHLATFRSFFPEKPQAIDAKVRNHLANLVPPFLLPYYAVTFEEAFPDGSFRRGVLVSQSPSVIREWLASMAHPKGRYAWEAFPFPSRKMAALYTQQWLNSR